MAKKRKSSSNQTLAVVGLLVNVLICPGLGSIIGGQTGPGIAQLIIFILGIPLSFIIIGIPLIFAAWIWGLVTGIQMVQNSAK